MDAEHAGEQGGGQFGGELEQGRGTGLSGTDPEVAEPFGELVGADGPAGFASGKQPSGGALIAETGVSSTGGDEVKDEAGEGFGELDGFVAEV